MCRAADTVTAMTESLLRQRLRAALPVAMKARDRAATAALRATLAAIDNAEAVAPDDAAAGSLAIEQVPIGAGATEVARRTLTEDAVEAIVRGELAERETAADAYERAGRTDRAELLRSEARALAIHLADGVITLRPLTEADVAAHNAGEDDRTVRWLTGSYGTIESTTRAFEQLADKARNESGKRGFGVCLDGRLAGYVDGDPDIEDGLETGDVNISYVVHPWARGRGVAVEAVRLMCAFLRERAIGARAAIRVEVGNHASVRVAEKSGFRCVREFVSGTDQHPDGTPATLLLFVRDLQDGDGQGSRPTAP